MFVELSLASVIHVGIHVLLNRSLEAPSDWSTDKQWFPGLSHTFPTHSSQFYVETMVLLVLFVAIDDVCSHLFIPALDFLTQNVERSVHGALFVSMGTSAPEIFTSVAGLWEKHISIMKRCRTATDTLQCASEEVGQNSGASVGMATIAGGAVVNILLVIAGCSWAIRGAEKDPRLPQPIGKASAERDILFVTLSALWILIVLLKSHSDGQYRLYFTDASVLVLLYVAYCLKCWSDSPEQAPKTRVETTRRPSKRSLQRDGVWELFQRHYTVEWTNVREVVSFVTFGAVLPIRLLRPTIRAVSWL